METPSQPSHIHIHLPHGQTRRLPRGEVRDLLRRRLLPAGTMYWQPGMDAWEPLAPVRSGSGGSAGSVSRGVQEEEKAVPKVPRLHGRVLKAVIGLALITLAFLIAGDLGSVLLYAAPHGADETAAAGTRQLVLSLLFLLLYGVQTGLFLSWLWRVERNLHLAGAQDLRFGPGLAVGWWFVPVANLWKPWQIVGELDRASQDPGGWAERRAHPLVHIWWGLSLGCLALLLTVLVLAFAASDAAGQQVAAGLSAVQSFLTGVMLILTILLVTRITRLQAGWGTGLL